MIMAFEEANSYQQATVLLATISASISSANAAVLYRKILDGLSCALAEACCAVSVLWFRCVHESAFVFSCIVTGTIDPQKLFHAKQAPYAL